MLFIGLLLGRMQMPRPVPNRSDLTETIVIYHAPDEGGWIAHGLRTDQVGIASTPVDALAQLLRLVHALIEEAAADRTLEIFREAPEAIQAMQHGSTKLPNEIVEVAHWKAVGTWPSEWEVQPVQNNGSFVATIVEPSIA